MTIPTVGLNETTPAGNTYKRDGDDRIREYKIQNREVLEVDHNYQSSGQDGDAGKHKQVSLIEAADIGVGAVGKPIFGAQTVDGKPELMFTDEENRDVQITDDGTINAPTAAAIIAIIYPIGALYVTTKNENPGTTFGVGTWAAFGAGKVMVGINAADADFDTVEETGGAKTHFNGG